MNKKVLERQKFDFLLREVVVTRIGFQQWVPLYYDPILRMLELGFDPVPIELDFGFDLLFEDLVIEKVVVSNECFEHTFNSVDWSSEVVPNAMLFIVLDILLDDVSSHKQAFLFI